jgi:transcriptional regulator with XRE-family HTH domain
MLEGRIEVTYCTVIGISDRFSVHMQALKSYRERRKISQAELARLCAVSQPTICDIENGRQMPSVPLLKRITKVTGLSADKLLAN